jgi:hypothetical protein
MFGKKITPCSPWAVSQQKTFLFGKIRIYQKASNCACSASRLENVLHEFMATSNTTPKGMECPYYLDGWYMVKVKDENLTACRITT